MKRNLLSTVTFVLLTTCESLHAASQLAPFYEAVAKDPYAVMDIDLFKLVPSEEIPVLARVLNSGNSDLMLRAISGATAILQVHANAELPQFQPLKPPIAEVKQEFQTLVPILLDHFNDKINKDAGVFNGLSDGFDIEWKTRVVTFMQLLGATPSSDMVTWMTEVIQWPNNDGGRLERALSVLDADMKSVAAKGGPKLSNEQRNASANTNSNNELGVALAVIPVLARFDPLPPSAMDALTKRMDDSSEPYGAAAAILNLSQNPSINRIELANRLVAKALDTKLPADIGAAAIHGIGFLGFSSARAKLAGLHRDPNQTIAGAAMDAGVYDNRPLH